MSITEQRAQARATYSANMINIGAHTRLDLAIDGDFIAAPAGASHILIQSIDQNVRYTTDTSLATTTHGFRLTAGNDPILVDIPGSGEINPGLSVAEEAVGAILQYQWQG